MSSKPLLTETFSSVGLIASNLTPGMAVTTILELNAYKYHTEISRTIQDPPLEITA